MEYILEEKRKSKELTYYFMKMNEDTTICFSVFSNKNGRQMRVFLQLCLRTKSEKSSYMKAYSVFYHYEKHYFFAPDNKEISGKTIEKGMEKMIPLLKNHPRLRLILLHTSNDPHEFYQSL